MQFVHALYSIFKFTAVLGQLLCDFKRTAGDIATDGVKVYELTDVKSVGSHS
jgi:hypothetical protein